MLENIILKGNPKKKSPENPVKNPDHCLSPENASIKLPSKEQPELAPIIAKNQDQRNNGKFDYNVAATEFLKGLVSPFTRMFSSWGNFALGCSMMMLAVAVPATLPIFVSIGLVYGGIKSLEFLSKLIYAATTRQNGDYVEQSFKSLGEATSSFGLSALGARSALSRAKLTSAEELTKISLLEVFVKNITSLPKTFNLSWQTLRSGEFLVNLKAAFNPFKFNKNPDDPNPPRFSDISSTNPNPQGPNNIIIRAMELKAAPGAKSFVPSNTLISSGAYLRSAADLQLQSQIHQSPSTALLQAITEKPEMFLANQFKMPFPQKFTTLPSPPISSSIALPLTINFPDSQTSTEDFTEIAADDLEKLTQIFIEELDLDPFNFEDQILISEIREAISANDQEKLQSILRDFGIDDSDLEKTQSQILENFKQQREEIIKLKMPSENLGYKSFDVKNSNETKTITKDNSADSPLTPEQNKEFTELMDQIVAEQIEKLRNDRSIEFATFLLGVLENCKNPYQEIKMKSKLFPGQFYSFNPYYLKDAVAFNQDLQRMAVTAVSKLLRKNNLQADEAAKIIADFYTTAVPVFKTVESPGFFRNHLNNTFPQPLIKRIKLLLRTDINPELLVDNHSAQSPEPANNITVLHLQKKAPLIAVENNSKKKESSLNYEAYQELVKSGDISAVQETVVIYFSLGQNKETTDAVKLLLKLLRDPDIDLEKKQKILRDNNLRIIANNTITSRELPAYLLGIISGLFNLDSSDYVSYQKLTAPQIKTLARYRNKTREEFKEIISVANIKQEIVVKEITAKTQNDVTAQDKIQVAAPTKQEAREEDLRKIRQELASKGIEFSEAGWKDLMKKFDNRVQNDILKFLKRISSEQLSLILNGEIDVTSIHPLSGTARRTYILHVTYNHRAQVKVKRDQGKIEIFSIKTKGEQNDDAHKSPALKNLLK